VSIPRLAGSFLLAALAGCGGGDELAVSRAAIANGELADHRGVVAVVTTTTGTICSGVVIAPRVILTARHCLAPIEHGPTVDCERTRFGATVDAAAIRVGSTSDGAIPNRRHGVVRVLVPDAPGFCGFDLAALVLRRPLDGATVVPLRGESAKSGETFSALGFGRDGPEQSGTRRRRDGLHVSCVGAACKNSQLSDREWWGEGAVCDGDSGGPALDADGRALGIASRKREGCTATVYVDLARSSAFVAAVLDEAARTPETEDAAGCAFGHGERRALPLLFTLLLTLWAARCRRWRRRPRDCARTPDPSAPPRCDARATDRDRDRASRWFDRRDRTSRTP
jgi:hypothetical protein